MRDRHIYLVFTQTGTWLSKLIYMFSNIKYAHASLSFDDSFTRMYSFGRTNPDNPFSGGFVVENLYDGVYKKFPKCECIIYRVAITEGQHAALKQQVERFIENKDQFRYNFLGLCCVLFNMPLNRRNHYFCSQFVSEILIKSNIYDSNKLPELIRTDELFNLQNREIVYEGFAHRSRSYGSLRVLEG